jgi:hypothetical protein
VVSMVLRTWQHYIRVWALVTPAVKDLVLPFQKSVIHIKYI